MPEQVTMYTPEKVAELAQCAIQTIYRHIRDDSPHFPHARIIGKRKWFIPEQDVTDYLGYNPSEVTFNIVQ